ncbi:DUF3017 domain-containing protein [Streptomyces sp. NPDC054933]
MAADTTGDRRGQDADGAPNTTPARTNGTPPTAPGDAHAPQTKANGTAAKPSGTAAAKANGAAPAANGTPPAATPNGTGAKSNGAAPAASPNGTAAAQPDGTAAKANGTAPGSNGTTPVAPRTRRFPEVTQDTARPEGGGRAAGGAAPAPARQWPLLTVLAGVAFGLAITAAGGFRVGLIVVGGCLLLGAVLRWLLPSVGMLAVRSRFTDLITYGGLGTAIVLLALMIQPKPILHLPFLDDIVHFAVR